MKNKNVHVREEKSMKKANMSAYIYGKSKGDSRFVGSKKKTRRIKRGK